MASKYDIRDPNRQFNDWDAVEQQIIRLDKRIDDVEVGNVDFENISGSPSDNVALKEAFDAKTDKIDFDALEASFQEVVTALDNKVDKATGKELMPSDLPGTVTDHGLAILDLHDRMDNAEEAITDLEDEKVDKEEGKSLVSDEDITQITTNKDNIAELATRMQEIQVRIIPEAGADYLGKVLQYIGPTTETYVNGYFYQCDYDTDLAAYTWVQKYTQPVGEVDLSNYYTKTETNNLLQNKQDTMTAGDGIRIVGNTIMQNILDDTISSPSTTWSSRYLESLFHSLSGLSAVEIVDERPAVPTNNTMYYVKDFVEPDPPLYEIWFYSNNTWTNFGTTAIDLTNYYTKSEVDALLAQKQATLTEGTGIRISNNNVEVKIDGTTIKVNSAGNLYVEGGGGGGGKTYYSGPGITVDNDNNIIKANTDNTSIEVNNQDKIQVKEVGYEKVLVNATDPDNKVYLPTKITEIENDIGQNATDIQSLDTNKADKGSSYTKSEEDTLLGGKADVGDSYTKAEDDALLNDKYDKTGGQLDGTIVAGTGVENIIRNSETNRQLTIYSGTAWNNGAALTIVGKDNTSRPGYFRLSANNGTNNPVLEGRPDGTLTWNGKNVITNNGNVAWTNISWASGTTGTGQYCVKNGICIVNIITMTKSTSTSWSIAATGLPIPDATGDFQIRLNNMTGNGTITQSRQMWVNNGTYYGQIIYPVKNL